MKKNSEKIDELIREALSEEEAKFYDALEEQGLMGKLSEVHRGKLGWLTIIMNVVHLMVFGLFVYCLVMFFRTDQTNELIMWASAGFIGLIFMGMIKLFVWMQIDKNDILRELKRLELQVSVLSSKYER